MFRIQFLSSLSAIFLANNAVGFHIGHQTNVVVVPNMRSFQSTQGDGEHGSRNHSFSRRNRRLSGRRRRGSSVGPLNVMNRRHLSTNDFDFLHRDADYGEILAGGTRYEMVELPDSMVDTTIFVGNLCEVRICMM